MNEPHLAARQPEAGPPLVDRVIQIDDQTTASYAMNFALTAIHVV